jgi:hypothetical protein
MNGYVNLCLYLAEFFFRKINVSDKSFRENQNTHFVFSNFLLNRAVYEIM